MDYQGNVPGKHASWPVHVVMAAIFPMHAERRGLFGPVCEQRAHWLPPGGERQFQRRPAAFNLHVPAAFARATCTLIAAWRRTKDPNKPSRVQLAGLGGSTSSARVQSAPRRAPRVAMPRGCSL